VFDKEERRVLGTFLAIPDYRLRPSDKTIITFAERPAGMPVAVKAWTYPGRNYGHEFVYPKRDAVALAEANQTPVPSLPEELAVNETNPAITRSEIVVMSRAPLMAEEPAGQEVQIADAFEVTPNAGLPDQLPATGSSLPLIGLIGLLSMGTAAALRVAAVRAK